MNELGNDINLIDRGFIQIITIKNKQVQIA